MPNEIIEADFEERESISIAHFVENNPFEKIVAAKVAQVREEFERMIDKGLKDISQMGIQIRAHGSVCSGEIKIEFMVCGTDPRYSQDDVKSHTLSEALKEFFRRKGFDNANNALLLSRHNETIRT